VHLRTLSGNTPHPQASDIIRPTYIPKDGAPLSDQGAYRFSVMGDSISLLDDDKGMLLIWNWWTGKLICVSQFTERISPRLIDPNAPTL
jgi:hypothetical protein